MEITRLWMTISSLTLLLLMSGCASSQTVEEKEKFEDTRRIAEANWYACEAIYKQAGRPTYHLDHTHKWDERRPSRAAVWNDLFVNDCKQLLGEEWLEYGDE